MKAIVIARPGGPEVLELRDVADPAPQRGEVLVRVRAAGVNRADLLQRAGFYPAPADAPADIPGLEYAGEVEAVGQNAELAVGDRVFGLVPGGAYAQKVIAPARGAVRVPKALSFAQAAACPEAFLTAWDAMVSQAGLAAGETVLIHAVGSGVGTAALQIARAIGAIPIGTSRTQAKLDAARALGLTSCVVVPASGAFADDVKKVAPGGADVIIDLVGGPYVNEGLRCLAPKGRLVLVGLLAGARGDVDLGLLLRTRALVKGTVLRSRPPEERIAALQAFGRHVVPLLAQGALKPVLDRTFPLARASEAHAYVAGNDGFGKVVLDVE